MKLLWQSGQTLEADRRVSGQIVANATAGQSKGIQAQRPNRALRTERMDSPERRRGLGYGTGFVADARLLAHAKRPAVSESARWLIYRELLPNPALTIAATTSECRLCRWRVAVVTLTEVWGYVSETNGSASRLDR